MVGSLEQSSGGPTVQPRRSWLLGVGWGRRMEEAVPMPWGTSLITGPDTNPERWEPLSPLALLYSY